MIVLAWTRHLKLFSALACLVIACVFAVPATSQTPAAPNTDQPPAVAEVPTDPLKRETPRGSVTGLLESLSRQDYVGAAAYFEGSDPDDAESDAELAKVLQASLDHGGELLAYGALSNDPLGRHDDQLPPDEERVGTLGNEEGTPIILVRNQSDEYGLIWLISRDTLSELESAPIADTELPTDSHQFAGAPVWDWGKLLATAAGSFLLFWLAASAILWLANRLLTGARAKYVLHFVQAALPPASLLLAIITFQFWTRDIDASIVARQNILRYLGIAGWAALAWFGLRLTDAVTSITALRMERFERRQAASLVALIRRAFKIVIVAIALLAILDTLGFDVTTGVAALGVGGIALALGAQKTIENLVGCIAVIADRPVEVGDFCRVGDTLGTVTDIGIRSTRIRTNERTEVAIPNSDFSSQRIENYTRRDRFLFNPRIGLVYNTDASGMREALRLVRQVLSENELVIKEDARARFIDLGNSALEIEIFAYINSEDYPGSLEIREELLLSIMEKLEEGKFSIAFPTQTIRLEGNADRSVDQPVG